MLSFTMFEKFRTADGREFLLESNYSSAVMMEKALSVDPTAQPVGIEIASLNRAQLAARREAIREAIKNR